MISYISYDNVSYPIGSDMPEGFPGIRRRKYISYSYDYVIASMIYIIYHMIM